MNTPRPLPNIVAGLRAAPTGLRLLLALSLALLPLGAMAVFAAVDSYRYIRTSQTAAVRATLELLGGKLDNLFIQESLVLRAAEPLDILGETEDICAPSLMRLDQVDTTINGIAVYRANGNLLCRSNRREPGRLRIDARADAKPGDVQLHLGPAGDVEMFMISPVSGYRIVAHIPSQLINDLAKGTQAYQAGQLVLNIGGTGMVLSPLRQPKGFGARIEQLSRPVFQNHASLDLRYPRVMVRPGELLSAMLPFLMWIAAIGISWIVVNGLLLRPLSIMRRAVEGYAHGDHEIRLLPLDPPGLEAARLAAAFDGMADAAAAHESEIELSVERQRELTREVHHRVKNNLQVVASLLSVQSRSATTPEVAAAYASIQQRVDALALVHRHHYAEAEISHGIDLKTLLGELSNALQASFFQMAGQPLDLALKSEPLRGLQDTALPMAFLLTEVASTLAESTGQTPPALQVSLRGADVGRALLCFASPSFIGEDIFSPQSSQHHARIVNGLVRQLRSQLHHDAETGDYSVEIAVVPPQPR